MSQIEEIARAVRDIRKTHKLTQSQLATIAGVSLPSVNRLENAKETIRLDVLAKIADSLGYKVVLTKVQS